MDNGQKKAAGELIQDGREINQEAQNNNQGGVVSKSIEAIKHFGKLLKVPFFFSAPPSQVAEFAKKINETAHGGLPGLLSDPGNCEVLSTCSLKPTDRGADPVVPSLKTQFGTAEQTRSPLILDLDGLNGAETLGKTAGIHFDHDGNKFAEQSGWVGQNDGLLVWDKNGNGQIDNGAELFGNNTVLKNGSKADNGFTALADLDANKDGKVDANDAASSQLRVFKDANANGVVDAGELLTLAEAGVKSLNTGYTTQDVADANGNQHLQAGSFTTTAGQTRAMDDVWFAVDTARTVDNDLVAVNDTIAALPDIEGFGNVHSLHQAMARDGSGKLQDLVQQYAVATDTAVRASLLNDLIYRWAGVQDIDPASRAAGRLYGNVIGDARKLATLETFLGQGYQGTWCWGERDPNPHGQAAPVLLKAYDELAGWVDSQLLAQTLFRPLYESIGLRYNPDDQSLDWDVTAVVATLRSHYDANPAQGLALMVGFVENLKIMEEAGTQIQAKLRQQGNGRGQGFDLYLDALGDNLLTGTAGEDTLNAKAGADNFFSGGKGADILNGGNGADFYLWSKGDGNDTINEAVSTGVSDTLRFFDVVASEVRLSRRVNDLCITIGAEQIMVTNHFVRTSAALELIQFSDDSTWQKSVLDAAPSLYLGTSGDDTLVGTSQPDTIEGGKGVDTLYGGAGNDCYLWLKGDGNDTINDVGAVKDVDTLKLADAKAADAALSRDTVNLYVTIGTEKITIKDHFASYMAAPIEQILFADGGKWQKADLDAALYRGDDGDDTIYGTTSAETFLGGKGADTLYGGAGGDTYTWLKGDGNDTINDVGAVKDIDTLKLADAKAADAVLSRDTANLYVTIGAEKITIKDHFAAYMAAPIEQILFADGGKWQKTDLDVAAYRGGNGADTIYGTASAESFVGGKGADTLYGGAGGDSYAWVKGDGNDVISDYDNLASKNIDTLKLVDVAREDIQLSRDPAHLYVTILSTGEKIQVFDHFSNYGAGVERIEFSSGDALLLADLNAAPYRGTAGKDTLSGTAAAETFIGGKGVDELWGGAGGDSYAWAKGDGNDVISDYDGLTSKNIDVLKLVDVAREDVLLSRDPAHLYVTIVSTGEKIQVFDHFTGNGGGVERVEFSRGNPLLLADLNAAAYRGTTGKDTLSGTAAAETFIGGKEVDALWGGAGGDSYVWTKGDGNDVISDYDSVASKNIDVLKLADVAREDVLLSRDTAHLYVTIVSTGEKIQVFDYFSGYGAGVERIEFASGDPLLLTDLNAAPYRGTTGKDTLSGTAAAETFIGGKGADALWGGAGGDSYVWTKGDGNDVISDYDSLTSKNIDVLKLVDVAREDVQLSRDPTHLYVTILPTGEKIQVFDHFTGNGGGVERVEFSSGNPLLLVDLNAAPYRGTTGKDTLSGTAAVETFIGGKEVDALWGGAGGDSYVWAKGDGNDIVADYDSLTGKNTDTLKLVDVAREDVLLSRDLAHLYVTIVSTAERIQIFDHFTGNGGGVERVEFSSGNPLLLADLNDAPYRGTAGKDTLSGTAAAETFIGGKGIDTLWGGAGSDSYAWAKGEGNDVISDYDSLTSKNVDTLKLVDVAREDVLLSRDAAHLYVTVVSTGEKIQVFDHFTGNGGGVERVEFASGNPLLLADLNAAVFRGTGGADTITGTNGNDVLDGQAGNDVLAGGAGSDVYQMGRGYGADTIQESDTKAGNTDVLQFMAGINADQLWFRKAGNNLEASIIGTADKAIVQNWYLGNAYHVEQIKAGDGKVLLDTQVDKLVQAMAGFTPPAMGQTTLTAAQQTALASVLAANWH